MNGQGKSYISKEFSKAFSMVQYPNWKDMNLTSGAFDGQGTGSKIMPREEWSMN